jgi:hypothetical protein
MFIHRKCFFFFLKVLYRAAWVKTVKSRPVHSFSLLCLLQLSFTWAGVAYPWLSRQVIAPLCFSALAASLFVIWEWKFASIPVMPRKPNQADLYLHICQTFLRELCVVCLFVSSSDLQIVYRLRRPGNSSCERLGCFKPFLLFTPVLSTHLRLFAAQKRVLVDPNHRQSK